MCVCGENKNMSNSSNSIKYATNSRMASSLVSRNITILGRRTSIRLEPEMWVALNDIANREACSVHDICALVYVRKSMVTSLTAAIRVFLMLYYRAATTEAGHDVAGHGNFTEMKKRAGISNDCHGFFKASNHSKQQESIISKAL